MEQYNAAAAYSRTKTPARFITQIYQRPMLDPGDRKISKKQWETQLRCWKKELHEASYHPTMGMDALLRPPICHYCGDRDARPVICDNILYHMDALNRITYCCPQCEQGTKTQCEHCAQKMVRWQFGIAKKLEAIIKKEIRQRMETSIKELLMETNGTQNHKNKKRTMLPIKEEYLRWHNTAMMSIKDIVDKELTKCISTHKIHIGLANKAMYAPQQVKALLLTRFRKDAFPGNLDVNDTFRIMIVELTRIHKRCSNSEATAPCETAETSVTCSGKCTKGGKFCIGSCCKEHKHDRPHRCAYCQDKSRGHRYDPRHSGSGTTDNSGSETDTTVIKFNGNENTVMLKLPEAQWQKECNVWPFWTIWQLKERVARLLENDKVIQSKITGDKIDLFIKNIRISNFTEIEVVTGSVITIAFTQEYTDPTADKAAEMSLKGS